MPDPSQTILNGNVLRLFLQVVLTIVVSMRHNVMAIVERYLYIGSNLTQILKFQRAYEHYDFRFEHKQKFSCPFFINLLQFSFILSFSYLLFISYSSTIAFMLIDVSLCSVAIFWRYRLAK